MKFETPLNDAAHSMLIAGHWNAPDLGFRHRAKSLVELVQKLTEGFAFELASHSPRHEGR